jgi:hypothetical protein
MHHFDANTNLNLVLLPKMVHLKMHPTNLNETRDGFALLRQHGQWEFRPLTRQTLPKPDQARCNRASLSLQHPTIPRLSRTLPGRLGSILVTFMVTQNLFSIVFCSFTEVKGRFA